MLTAELSERQAAALAELAQLQKERDPERQWRHSGAFYEHIDSIARLLQAHPELRDCAEHRDFLRESSTRLAFLPTTSVLSYPLRRHHDFMGVWESGTWVQACRFRSEVQSLVDMYHGTDFEPFLSQIDLPGLDESLQEWAEHEAAVSPADMPEGTPPSHWWWSHPRAPSPRGG